MKVPGLWTLEIDDSNNRIKKSKFLKDIKRAKYIEKIVFDKYGITLFKQNNLQSQIIDKQVPQV